MTKREAWLQKHAYLRPLADFCAQVDVALARIPIAAPSEPGWEDYVPEFAAGVPLLRSYAAAPELAAARERVGAQVATLIQELAAMPVAEGLGAEARALAAADRESSAALRVVDWLLGDEDLAPASPGLMRYLGWTALARHLDPVLKSFAARRDEDRWLRSSCPSCGARPAMGQLIGVDPGRKRLLSCGCCRTRWRYKRTGCPFCENDSQRLGVVGIEGEGGLRIDYCESCRGYLKTYDGQGDESLLLADWSSLHLDVIAHDRGLERMATSLYEFEPAASAS